MRVYLRATPGSARDAMTGLQPDADGKIRLKINVTTVAEDGKANKAVLALLAKTWRVPKSSLTLIAGETNRLKTVLIAGDGAVLLQQLTDWLSATGFKAPS